LLHDVIKKDLHLTSDQVANSNIIALVATLLVRLVAGPACDRFGPRYTFAGCLLIGAIPTFLSGTAYNVHQLYALRFFIGILGGSFVPCQVWTTGFFDKNIVGTANSIAAGFGNAGGGITYFAMPAIYNSFVTQQGLTEHVAWRVSFVVPGILIVSVATLLILLCPDTPTGKWSERMQATPVKHAAVESTTIVDIPGHVTEKDSHKTAALSSSNGTYSPNTQTRSNSTTHSDEKKSDLNNSASDPEAQIGEAHDLTDDTTTTTATNETIQKPTLKEILAVSFSPQTLVTGAAYFCTFGAELAVNSILGSYYTQRFPTLDAQQTGNWAAMFGLMNVVWRPLGGVVGDVAYHYTQGSVWAKKILLHTYGVGTGVMLLVIGLVNPGEIGSMVALVAVGLAFFLAGANGLTFSLVPHVHPSANGVVSGFTGACGNLGGIVFAIIFRYGDGYATSIWIIGAIVIGINVAVSWIKPVPSGQVGGR
jgi:NNP family nitrate/nitrite transporter-like MFS transporter